MHGEKAGLPARPAASSGFYVVNLRPEVDAVDKHGDQEDKRASHMLINIIINAM